MYYVNRISVYAIAIIFPSLCCLCVILRFVARRQKRLKYGPDDWAALVTLVPVIGCATILIVGNATHTIGWFTPHWTLHQALYGHRPKNTLFTQLQYVFLPVAVLAIGGVRLTFVLLYRRLFLGRWLSIITNTILVIIVLWTIAFFFASWFTCKPISAFWGTGLDYRLHCKHNDDIFLAMFLSDMIIDVALLLVPIVPILSLRLSMARKSLTVMVFSMGSFSIAAGLTRTIILAELSIAGYGKNGHLFGIDGVTNPRGIVATILWWEYVEIGVGCLASNLPPFLGLLLRAQTFAGRALYNSHLRNWFTGSSTATEEVGSTLPQLEIWRTTEVFVSHTEADKEAEEKGVGWTAPQDQYRVEINDSVGRDEEAQEAEGTRAGEHDPESLSLPKSRR